MSPGLARLVEVLVLLPPGRLMTYGELARQAELGSPRMPARLLGQLPDRERLPWWRIVNAQRRISEHGAQHEQHQRLAEEGLLPDTRGRYPARAFWP